LFSSRRRVTPLGTLFGARFFGGGASASARIAASR
jgi:hypothetical protein